MALCYNPPPIRDKPLGAPAFFTDEEQQRGIPVTNELKEEIWQAFTI